MVIKRNKLTISLAVLLGIAILFYPLAIVVRQYMVPFYANTFYRKSVENEFTASFTEFNNKLNSLGLSQYRSSGFDSAEKSATCYSGYYEGLSETVPCIKQISIDPFVPDDEFIATWKASSFKLLPILQANGWKMTGNLIAGSELATDEIGQTSITEVFDVPNRSPADQYATEINYSKTNGKTKCFLSFSYANNGPSPVKSVWLEERCARDVSFFGGSSG